MTIDITSQLSDEAAKALFELSWSLIKDLGKKTIDKIKVEKALHKYAVNYIRRHGEIKILGMYKPLGLNQIYTSVNIINPEYLYRDREITDMDDTFQKNRGDFGIYQHKVNAFTVANECGKLNVLGAPGSGKSTLLKKIGYDALKTGDVRNVSDQCYQHHNLPVLIELKKIRNDSVDIHTLIQNEFEIADFPESSSFVSNALKKGKLLILLDGLDEVPKSNLEYVIEQIRDFTDSYPLNRYITSCRTAFYKNFLQGYTDVEICSFDNEQISTFIGNWFDKESDININFSNSLITQLFELKNKSTLELARTPLLLSFLCMTFDEGQRFPSNKSNLYKRAMQILLEKWAAEKRIHHEDIYQDLNSDIEIEMLAEIAAYFYVKERVFFYADELKDQIGLFIKETLDVRLPPISKILDAIEVQQGLLVQRAPDIYSFSHLTIQEYLTAYHYYSPKRTKTLIETYLFNLRWKEVFILLAGMSNADDMIVMIVDYLKNYAAKNGFLKQVISWVNQVTTTEDSISGVCQRLFLISLIVRFKRYEQSGLVAPPRLEVPILELMNSIEPTFNSQNKLSIQMNKTTGIQILEIIKIWNNNKNSKEIDQAKAKINTLVPDRKLSEMAPGSRYGFRQQINAVINDTLKIPNQIANARKTSYKPIINYIEALKLIIECKNSSLRISSKTWDYVLQNILRP